MWRNYILGVILIWIIAIYYALMLINKQLDILIDQTQSWEEYCTENPFDWEEVM